MPSRCCEFVDSRLRRSPPDRASAVPYGQAGENAMRFPHLAHRSAAAHKLHSTPQQDRMNLISGKGETSSRLPGLFSLFLPGSCPNNRNRCRARRRARRSAGLEGRATTRFRAVAFESPRGRHKAAQERLSFEVPVRRVGSQDRACPVVGIMEKASIGNLRETSPFGIDRNDPTPYRRTAVRLFLARRSNLEFPPATEC